MIQSTPERGGVSLWFLLTGYVFRRISNFVGSNSNGSRLNCASFWAALETFGVCERAKFVYRIRNLIQFWEIYYERFWSFNSRSPTSQRYFGVTQWDSKEIRIISLSQVPKRVSPVRIHSSRHRVKYEGTRNAFIERVNGKWLLPPRLASKITACIIIGRADALSQYWNLSQ